MNNAQKTDNHIEQVVIVGGGTAGWMTAAALAKVLPKGHCEITLIESDDIGTVGVGEATIPLMSIYNSILGIDEDDFIKSTQGTFKLGIEFVNWGGLGESYIHPFGKYGTTIDALQFYNYWLRLHHMGLSDDIGEFSISVQAAPKGKFMRPNNLPNSPLSEIAYAYHFDAGLYAKYLRKLAEGWGVKKVEGTVDNVSLNPKNGYIDKVTLKNGESFGGDLFVDCTGFKALLMGQALNVGYEDWSDMLPCNKAVTVQTRNISDPVPYTKSTAHASGWQWKIPLQHRTGNGHVYCDKYITDDEAKQILLDNVEGDLLTEPRYISFQTGRRKKFWHKNCVAIGLSSGFIEPLESTSIHLIQSHISKLIALFPTKSFSQPEIDKYNSILSNEIIGIRDFIVLHYHATTRDDSPFWDYCRQMEVPEGLQEKLELYRSSGRIFRDNNELFDESSWIAVMHGQGVKAESYHPVVDTRTDEQIKSQLGQIKSVIERSVDTMPSHADFIRQHCAASKD